MALAEQDIGADFTARTQLAATTDAAFREHWALFRANHFTVSATKAITGTIVGPFEEEAVRPNVFGRFEDLLGAAESHPAMLTYLDTRANGAGGTDHGTASTALLLGGALKPGGIVGDWPTLRREALFENRDVAPTLDMRGLFKGVLAEHMGLDRAALDTAIFPSSAAVKPVLGLV